LLKSSQYSRKIGTSRNYLDIVAEETSPNHYIKSGIFLALLLEGSFHSMFENRVLPLTNNV
jgi:hypothetical protein